MRHTKLLFGLMFCPVLLAGPTLAVAAGTTEDPRYPPDRSAASSDNGADNSDVMEEAPPAPGDDAAAPTATSGDDGSAGAAPDDGSSGGDMDSDDGSDADAPAGPYDDYVPDAYNPPDTTGDSPPDTELVKRIFALSFAEQCSWALQGWIGDREPDTFDLTYRETYDEPSDPDRKMRLYRFDCDAGAYNLQSVWMEWEGIWGLRPLSFATPAVDVKYENDDTDAAVSGITVEGMTSYNTLTNSWYDEATKTIHSFAKWRGMADAFDAGAWQLLGTDFVLKSFDVDATYDGNENPTRVVEYPGALPMEAMPAGADGDEVDDTEDTSDDSDASSEGADTSTDSGM